MEAGKTVRVRAMKIPLSQFKRHREVPITCLPDCKFFLGPFFLRSFCLRRMCLISSPFSNQMRCPLPNLSTSHYHHPRGLGPSGFSHTTGTCVSFVPFLVRFGLDFVCPRTHSPGACTHCKRLKVMSHYLHFDARLRINC